MRRLPRLLVSAACGALLPLAFLGSLLRPEAGAALRVDMPAFYIVPPVLLFVMMASAFWILLCRKNPVSTASR